MMLSPTSVSFKCRVYTLAAHLYAPAEGSPRRKGAAVIFCPPWTGVKEQGHQIMQLLAWPLQASLASSTMPSFKVSLQANPGSLKTRHREWKTSRQRSRISSVDMNPWIRIESARAGYMCIRVGGGGGYACTAAQTDPRIRAVAAISAICIGAMARRGVSQKFGDSGTSPAGSSRGLILRPQRRDHRP